MKILFGKRNKCKLKTPYLYVKLGKNSELGLCELGKSGYILTKYILTDRLSSLSLSGKFKLIPQNEHLIIYMQNNKSNYDYKEV